MAQHIVARMTEQAANASGSMAMIHYQPLSSPLCVLGSADSTSRILHLKEQTVLLKGHLIGLLQPFTLYFLRIIPSPFAPISIDLISMLGLIFLASAAFAFLGMAIRHRNTSLSISPVTLNGLRTRANYALTHDSIRPSPTILPLSYSEVCAVQQVSFWAMRLG